MKNPKRKRVLIRLRDVHGRFTGQIQVRYFSTKKDFLTLVPLPGGGWRKVMIDREEYERRGAIAKRKGEQLSRDMEMQLRLPSNSAWMEIPFSRRRA